MAQKVNFVSAVPEQAFLPVAQVEVDVDLTAFQRQRSDCLVRYIPRHPYAIFNDLRCSLGMCLEQCSGRSLIVFSAPGRFDSRRRDLTGIIRAREDGASEYGPRDGGQNKNGDDGDDSLGHGAPYVMSRSLRPRFGGELWSSNCDRTMWRSTESVWHLHVRKRATSEKNVTR